MNIEKEIGKDGITVLVKAGIATFKGQKRISPDRNRCECEDGRIVVDGEYCQECIDYMKENNML